MHNKWQVALAFSSSLLIFGFSHSAMAADINAVLPTNDSSNCTALIQQGDAVPTLPTTDLHGLQICMNSCDILYRSLGDQKRYTEMLAGSAYCRKSLNNLYYASIAQDINDDLDTKTQQNSASLFSIINQARARQNQNSNQAPVSSTNPSTEPMTEPNEPVNNDQPATPTNTPSPSNDGINWF